jgi:hypothetical protein
VEQSVDPALRVTITGKEWRLYAVWEGGPVSSSAYLRSIGGWMRLSAGQVLIASSTAVSPGKRVDKSRTTVIDLALRLQIGTDGADPWTVRPGTYPGQLRLRLEGSSDCGSDERNPTLLAPDASTLDASSSVETSAPSEPGTPPVASDESSETSGSVEASGPPSLSTSTTVSVSDGRDGPTAIVAPGTGSDEVASAEPSAETSATISASGSVAAGVPASSRRAQPPQRRREPKSGTAEQRAKRPHSHPAAAIELSKPPADRPGSAGDGSKAPTDTVEPGDAEEPKSP